MRQLSFAFLQAGRHIAGAASKSGLSSNGLKTQPVTLRRIDPGKNMARFCSLDVERDLFGRVVLVRRWGRIGSAGRTRLDKHAGEGEAMAAFQRLQNAKTRKGYQDTAKP